MKRAFWILIVGVLSNAEGMNAVDLDSVLSEAQTVFRSICAPSTPRSIEFVEPASTIEINLSTLEGRSKLKQIREDDFQRPNRFTARVISSKPWNVTTEGLNLECPDGPMNYVVDYKGKKEGIPRYGSFLKHFDNSSSRKLLCKQVVKFLIKPEAVVPIEGFTEELNRYTEKLICLLMCREYVRAKQSLAIALMGHLFFKWHPEEFNTDKYKEVMVYPSRKNGRDIVSFSEEDMVKRFLNLWELYCNSESFQYSANFVGFPEVIDTLKANFLSRQLNKIKKIYNDFGYEGFSSLVSFSGKFKDDVTFMIEAQSKVPPELFVQKGIQPLLAGIMERLSEWKKAFEERFEEWNELKKGYFENANPPLLDDAKDDARSIYVELQDMCVEVECGVLKKFVCLRDPFEAAIRVMKDIKSVLKEESIVKAESALEEAE